MNEINAKNSDKPLWPVAKRQLAIAVMLLSGIVISACTDSRPPEQIVQERSQERVNALLDGNIKEALTFTTPSFQAITTADSYSARVHGASRWTNAVVDNVVCEQEVCDVVVMITYLHPRLGFENTRPIEESWVKLDGEWWLYQY